MTNNLNIDGVNINYIGNPNINSTAVTKSHAIDVDNPVLNELFEKISNNFCSSTEGISELQNIMNARSAVCKELTQKTYNQAESIHTKASNTDWWLWDLCPKVFELIANETIPQLVDVADSFVKWWSGFDKDHWLDSYNDESLDNLKLIFGTSDEKDINRLIALKADNELKVVNENGKNIIQLYLPNDNKPKKILKHYQQADRYLKKIFQDRYQSKVTNNLADKIDKIKNEIQSKLESIKHQLINGITDKMIPENIIHDYLKSLDSEQEKCIQEFNKIYDKNVTHLEFSQSSIDKLGKRTHQYYRWKVLEEEKESLNKYLFDQRVKAAECKNNIDQRFQDYQDRLNVNDVQEDYEKLQTFSAEIETNDWIKSENKVIQDILNSSHQKLLTFMAKKDVKVSENFGLINAWKNIFQRSESLETYERSARYEGVSFEVVKLGKSSDTPIIDDRVQKVLAGLEAKWDETYNKENNQFESNRKSFNTKLSAKFNQLFSKRKAIIGKKLDPKVASITVQKTMNDHQSFLENELYRWRVSDQMMKDGIPKDALEAPFYEKEGHNKIPKPVFKDVDNSELNQLSIRLLKQEKVSVDEFRQLKSTYNNYKKDMKKSKGFSVNSYVTLRSHESIEDAKFHRLITVLRIKSQNDIKPKILMSKLFKKYNINPVGEVKVPSQIEILNSNDESVITLNNTHLFQTISKWNQMDRSDALKSERKMVASIGMVEQQFEQGQSLNSKNLTTYLQFRETFNDIIPITDRDRQFIRHWVENTPINLKEINSISSLLFESSALEKLANQKDSGINQSAMKMCFKSYDQLIGHDNSKLKRILLGDDPQTSILADQLFLGQKWTQAQSILLSAAMINFPSNLRRVCANFGPAWGQKEFLHQTSCKNPETILNEYLRSNDIHVNEELNAIIEFLANQEVHYADVSLIGEQIISKLNDISIDSFYSNVEHQKIISLLAKNRQSYEKVGINLDYLDDLYFSISRNEQVDKSLYCNESKSQLINSIQLEMARYHLNHVKELDNDQVIQLMITLKCLNDSNQHSAKEIDQILGIDNVMINWQRMITKILAKKETINPQLIDQLNQFIFKTWDGEINILQTEFSNFKFDLDQRNLIKFQIKNDPTDHPKQFQLDLLSMKITSESQIKVEIPLTIQHELAEIGYSHEGALPPSFGYLCADGYIQTPNEKFAIKDDNIFINTTSGWRQLIRNISITTANFLQQTKTKKDHLIKQLIDLEKLTVWSGGDQTLYFYDSKMDCKYKFENNHLIRICDESRLESNDQWNFGSLNLYSWSNKTVDVYNRNHKVIQLSKREDGVLVDNDGNECLGVQNDQLIFRIIDLPSAYKVIEINSDKHIAKTTIDPNTNQPFAIWFDGKQDLNKIIEVAQSSDQVKDRNEIKEDSTPERLSRHLEAIRKTVDLSSDPFSIESIESLVKVSKTKKELFKLGDDQLDSVKAKIELYKACGLKIQKRLESLLTIIGFSNPKDQFAMDYLVNTIIQGDPDGLIPVEYRVSVEQLAIRSLIYRTEAHKFQDIESNILNHSQVSHLVKDRPYQQLLNKVYCGTASSDETRQAALYLFFSDRIAHPLTDNQYQICSSCLAQGDSVSFKELQTGGGKTSVMIPLIALYKSLKVADDKTIQRIGARITTPSALLAMNNDDISKIMNGLHAKAWIPTIDINAENYLEVFLEELINHKNHGDIMISSRDLDKLLENIKNQAITNRDSKSFELIIQIKNELSTMFEMIDEAPKVVDILEELNINNDHFELADKQLIIKRKELFTTGSEQKKTHYGIHLLKNIRTQVDQMQWNCEYGFRDGELEAVPYKFNNIPTGQGTFFNDKDMVALMTARGIQKDIKGYFSDAKRLAKLCIHLVQNSQYLLTNFEDELVNIKPLINHLIAISSEYLNIAELEEECIRIAKESLKETEKIQDPMALLLKKSIQKIIQSNDDLMNIIYLVICNQPIPTSRTCSTEPSAMIDKYLLGDQAYVSGTLDSNDFSAVLNPTVEKTNLTLPGISNVSLNDYYEHVFQTSDDRIGHIPTSKDQQIIKVTGLNNADLRGNGCIQSLISQINENPSVSIMVDSGALIQGVSNEDVAKVILEGTTKQAVIYIDSNSNKLKVKLSGKDLDMSYNQFLSEKSKLKINHSDIFTILDHARKEGTDVKDILEDDASAILSIGPMTSYADAKQALGRLRFKGHRFKLMLGETFCDEIFPETTIIKTSNVIEHVKKQTNVKNNQKIFKRVKDELLSIARYHLDQKIKQDPSLIKNEKFNHLSQPFFTQMSALTIQDFDGGKVSISTLEQLTSGIEKEVKKLAEQLERFAEFGIENYLSNFYLSNHSTKTISTDPLNLTQFVCNQAISQIDKFALQTSPLTDIDVSHSVSIERSQNKAVNLSQSLAQEKGLSKAMSHNQSISTQKAQTKQLVSQKVTPLKRRACTQIEIVKDLIATDTKTKILNRNPQLYYFLTQMNAIENIEYSNNWLDQLNIDAIPFIHRIYTNDEKVLILTSEDEHLFQDQLQRNGYHNLSDEILTQPLLEPKNDYESMIFALQCLVATNQREANQLTSQFTDYVNQSYHEVFSELASYPQRSLSDTVPYLEEIVRTSVGFRHFAANQLLAQCKLQGENSDLETLIINSKHQLEQDKFENERTLNFQGLATKNQSLDKVKGDVVTALLKKDQSTSQTINDVKKSQEVRVQVLNQEISQKAKKYLEDINHELKGINDQNNALRSLESQLRSLKLPDQKEREVISKKILRAQGELKQKIRNQNKLLNDYLSSIEKIIKNKAGNSKDVSHINQLKKFEPKDFTQLQDKKQSICEWMVDTMKHYKELSNGDEINGKLIELDGQIATDTKELKQLEKGWPSEQKRLKGLIEELLKSPSETELRLKAIQNSIGDEQSKHDAIIAEKAKVIDDILNITKVFDDSELWLYSSLKVLVEDSGYVDEFKKVDHYDSNKARADLLAAYASESKIPDQLFDFNQFQKVFRQVKQVKSSDEMRHLHRIHDTSVNKYFCKTLPNGAVNKIDLRVSIPKIHKDIKRNLDKFQRLMICHTKLMELQENEESIQESLNRLFKYSAQVEHDLKLEDSKNEKVIERNQLLEKDYQITELKKQLSIMSGQRENWMKQKEIGEHAQQNLNDLNGYYDSIKANNFDFVKQAQDKWSDTKNEMADYIKKVDHETKELLKRRFDLETEINSANSNQQNLLQQLSDDVSEMNNELLAVAQQAVFGNKKCKSKSLIKCREIKRGKVSLKVPELKVPDFKSKLFQSAHQLLKFRAPQFINFSKTEQVQVSPNSQLVKNSKQAMKEFTDKNFPLANFDSSEEVNLESNLYKWLEKIFKKDFTSWLKGYLSWGFNCSVFNQTPALMLHGAEQLFSATKSSSEPIKQVKMPTFDQGIAELGKPSKGELVMMEELCQ